MKKIKFPENGIPEKFRQKIFRGLFFGEKNQDAGNSQNSQSCGIILKETSKNAYFNSFSELISHPFPVKEQKEKKPLKTNTLYFA